MRTLTFHMMVMAFLHRAHLGLKAQNLSAVFAQNTRRGRHIPKRGMTFAFFLGQGDALFRRDLLDVLPFDGQNLCAVLACPTVWRRSCAVLLQDTLRKRLQHLRVIAQVTRFDEMDIWMFCCNLIGKAVDPVDQNA